MYIELHSLCYLKVYLYCCRTPWFMPDMWIHTSVSCHCIYIYIHIHILEYLAYCLKIFVCESSFSSSNHSHSSLIDQGFWQMSPCCGDFTKEPLFFVASLDGSARKKHMFKGWKITEKLLDFSWAIHVSDF